MQEAAEVARLPVAARAGMIPSRAPDAGYEATWLFVVRFSLAFSIFLFLFFLSLPTFLSLVDCDVYIAPSILEIL